MELVAGIAGRVDLALVLIEDADVLDRPAKMLVQAHRETHRRPHQNSVETSNTSCDIGSMSGSMPSAWPWALIGTVRLSISMIFVPSAPGLERQAAQIRVIERVDVIVPVVAAERSARELDSSARR